MRKRLYHHFPKDDVEFQQKYSFWADLPYLVKIFAGMNNKSGSFKMVTPKGDAINAKRNIAVEIAEANIDFKPLVNKNLDNILETIENNGTIDFKIQLLYSYLNKDYHRLPARGDDFLIRSNLADGVLTLMVHHEGGPGHTTCNEIANTIVDELGRGHTD